jgi:malonyl-CoA/methylmalonyl-CoA synthetase
MNSAHFAKNVNPLSVNLLKQNSLPRALHQIFRSNREKPALFFRDSVLSNAELDQRSAQVADNLLRRGLKRGDRVILSSSNSPALVCCHLALLRSGIVAVPTNTSYVRPELHHIVNDVDVNAAIIESSERQNDFAAVSRSGSFVGSPQQLFDETEFRKDYIDNDSASFDALPTSDDPAMIGFTSGTTGKPKGALLSHANLLAGTNSVSIAWRWTNNDRLIVGLPLFHAHGMLALHGSLLNDASSERIFD